MDVSLCVNVCDDVIDVTHTHIRLVYKIHKTHEKIIESKLEVSQMPTT